MTGCIFSYAFLLLVGFTIGVAAWANTLLVGRDYYLGFEFYFQLAAVFALGIICLFFWGLCLRFFIKKISHLLARIKSRIKDTFSTVRGKMIWLAVLVYLLMCVFCVANCEFWRHDEKLAAAWEVTFLFGWAFWEVFLLTKTPNRKELSRRQKLYSVLSFLAVPLVGLFFVVFFRAYREYEFLNLTLLVFAPAAFPVTKICYRLHEAVDRYLEDSGDGTA